MTAFAALLFSSTLLLRPDSGLRLYNPHEQAVDAVVVCDGVARPVSIAAHDAADAGTCSAFSIDAPLPLSAIETRNEDSVETQRPLSAASGCETLALEAPLFACARGTATVVVPEVPGATYTWTVTGATITGGDGTRELTLALGEGPSAHISATITGECASAAEAVIAIRPPLVVEKLEVPAVSAANSPVTITWSYPAGTAPASQLLTGDAFDAPVTLGGAARSYTFTPALPGIRKVELSASYATAIATKPAGRRRASGKSRATASECPSVRASRQLEVRGCSNRELTIHAPKTVEAGETFIATVSLQTGESAKWSVTQGTIVSGETSDAVTVKAAETGTVNLRLTVTAGPDCTMTDRDDVTIVPRAVCSTTAPTVALSIVKTACDLATVKATFTGTPPFTGMWIDGKTFTTSERSITHDFTSPGTYTIRNFRDSLCAGTVSETARVPLFPPDATLSSNGNCPGSKVTAAFVGTPPFEGRWSDGESFTTSSGTLTRTANRTLWIEWYRDAACPSARGRSNAIEITESPRAFVNTPFSCSNGTTIWIPVRIFGPNGSYTVYWSDGATTTGINKGETYFFVTREYVMKSFDQTLKITKVTTPSCDATVETPEARVSYRPSPTIDSAKSNTGDCLGKTMNIVLKPNLHPTAKIQWTVPEGTRIVSGQGTTELTFIHDRKPFSPVTASYTHPDGECNFPASTFTTYAAAPPQITAFSVDRTEIKPGESVKVTLNINDEVEYLGVQVYPKPLNNTFPLGSGACDSNQRRCVYTWKAPLTYTGEVAMVAGAGNDCGPIEAEVRFQVKP
ncbi:MAG TPA: hypothetical protein VM733_11275 [Thermoanaerobaculia bacterium]|nr:hypothetical protein [Thermoanaerobaculia bacterium]